MEGLPDNPDSKQERALIEGSDYFHGIDFYRSLELEEENSDKEFSVIKIIGDREFNITFEKDSFNTSHNSTQRILRIQITDEIDGELIDRGSVSVFALETKALVLNQSDVYDQAIDAIRELTEVLSIPIQQT